MNVAPCFLPPVLACRPSGKRLPFRVIAGMALLLSCPIILHAAADLPPGNRTRAAYRLEVNEYMGVDRPS